MSTIQVDAKANSIADGNAAVFTFSKPVEIGDKIFVTVPISDFWKSGNSGRSIGADGVPVDDGVPNWSSVDPKTPKANRVPNTPNAVNYQFAVGCLVGSLDGGNTFFSIGTNFQMTVLSGEADSLSLYFWDINNNDNSGTITANVEVYTP